MIPLPDLDKPSDAIISRCSQYRYWLHRSWIVGKGWLVFIMLNPSTADASIDDPTIRRCIGFARWYGFKGTIVVNLFAGRASKPVLLFDKKDPIGPFNDRYIWHALQVIERDGGIACAAWGSNKEGIKRSKRRRAWLGEIIEQAHCLGTTDDGHPRHPLYVPRVQPLIVYRP